MKFHTKVTCGGEVVFAGSSHESRPIYYGSAPESGLWRVNIPEFEKFVADALAPQSFGNSIDEFCFGLEIAELTQWGPWFASTHDYMSHRPKSKTFISVGQLEWQEVKDLSAFEQWSRLGDALVSSIDRIATAKRKPKNFDHAALAQAVRGILLSCKPPYFAADEGEIPTTIPHP